MKIIFAGGGTGGHINPAISIANYIKEKDSDFEALFIGTERGLETRLVPKAGYRIEYIDIQGFDRKNMLKNIKVLKKLAESKKKCRKSPSGPSQDISLIRISSPVVWVTGKSPGNI